MRVGLLVALLIAFLAGPAAAGAVEAEGDGELCSATADVAWRTDHDDMTVEAAVVEVADCDDGEPVGLQLLTDGGGEVPVDGPMLVEAQDGRATFDLSPFEQPIEPVVGVRVFLRLTETEVASLEITVEQRFFNRPGNEQRGRSRSKLLDLAPGGQYHVPEAPRGYEEVACAEVGLPGDDTVVGEGSGAHTATESGRHLVCYRQTPGEPRGPVDEEEPEVLGELEEQPTATDGEAGPPGTTGGGRDTRAPGDGDSDRVQGRLATTGGSVLLLGAAGTLLLLVGRRLVRTGRTA